MSTFTLTRHAKTDLKSIAKFTKNSWGREQRYIYIKQFNNTFHVISDTPAIGNNGDYIKENYQKFPQGSHVIFLPRILSKKILKLFASFTKIWTHSHSLVAQS